MSTPENDPPSKDPDEIEAEIARHRAELGRTVDELGDRLDVGKQASRQWEATRRKVGNSAAVAADNARLALVRVQNAPPRQWALVLGPAAGLAGVVVLIAVFTRRRRP